MAIRSREMINLKLVFACTVLLCRNAWCGNCCLRLIGVVLDWFRVAKSCWQQLKRATLQQWRWCWTKEWKLIPRTVWVICCGMNFTHYDNAIRQTLLPKVNELTKFYEHSEAMNSQDSIHGNERSLVSCLVWQKNMYKFAENNLWAWYTREYARRFACPLLSDERRNSALHARPTTLAKAKRYGVEQLKAN